jgi:hypothetical protein
MQCVHGNTWLDRVFVTNTNSWQRMSCNMHSLYPVHICMVISMYIWQEFSPLCVVQTGSGSTQPTVQWEREVKRPGREADHSPPTSVEVKKMCIYTTTPRTPSWRSA